MAKSLEARHLMEEETGRQQNMGGTEKYFSRQFELHKSVRRGSIRCHSMG